MKKLTLCIFDMDGLLIDSERGMWFKSEKKAFSNIGYPVNEDFLKSMMGVSGEDLKKLLKDRYGKDFPFEKYNAEVYAHNEETIEQGDIALMPGAIELLNYLEEHKVRCVIGTGTPKAKAEKILKKVSLAGYFEEIFSGYDVPHGKPAPDIWLKCLGDTKAEEALVFEDSANGAKAAIAAGIDLVLVPDLSPISDELRKKAFKVLDSLDEAIPFIKEMTE